MSTRGNMLHRDTQDNFLIYLAATDKLVIEAAVVSALEEALPDQEVLEDNSTCLIWGTPEVEAKILPDLRDENEQNLTIEITVDLLSHFDEIEGNISLLHKSCLADVLREVSVEFVELYKNIFSRVTVIYSIESDSYFRPYISEIIEATLDKPQKSSSFESTEGCTVYEE